MKEKEIPSGAYITHDNQETITSTKVVNKKLSNMIAIAFLVSSITGGVLFYNSPSQVNNREAQENLEEIKNEYIMELGEQEDFAKIEFKNLAPLQKVFVVMKETGCTEEEAIEMLVKDEQIEKDPKIDNSEEVYTRIRKQILGY